MHVGKIIVHGKASGKSWILELEINDYLKTVLDFLREKDIPLASSCRGLGTCKKCTINQTLLACQLTIQEFIEKNGDEILIGYL